MVPPLRGRRAADGAREKAGHSGRDDSARQWKEKSKSGRPEGRPLQFAGVGEPAEVGAGDGGDGED
jgi:hypothetical protein